jgi:hypothetical protein
LGTLLLFEDFLNYKAQLAALPKMPTGKDDRQVTKQEVVEGSNSTPWAFEVEGTVPESCVDWSAIEEKLKAQD